MLDPVDRRLWRDDTPVDVNARYLDALALLVRQAGTLVPKDRFMDDVWRGVPVTDEALTQCIKTLRRHLGDDAANPRFIETVPKHGYRFIAPVEAVGAESPAPAQTPVPPAPTPAQGGPWRRILLLGGAGTIGGGLAGLAGGLLYGFIGASDAPPNVGAISVLLVMASVSTLVAVLGAAGVSFGIAACASGSNLVWRHVGGGALGGLIVGALAKLLGLDAFNLLFGRSPGDITGGGEGALLGAAVGLGMWLATRTGATRSFRRALALAALSGGGAGLLVTASGGRLMAGSLDLLAQSFPGSRLRLDAVGRLVGEAGLGPVARTMTGTLEGALFAACIVGAVLIARRGTDETR